MAKIGGQDLYETYQWARAVAWRYHLDQFEAEALLSILATLDKGRREVMREFQARYAGANLSDWQEARLEALLYEMEDLTAGVRSELTQQYTTMSVTVAAPSITETVGALSVAGLARGVNNVALSPAQLRTFFQETPMGGRLIQEWVDRSFAYSVQGQIRQAINVGVLRGEGYPGLVRRVEDGFGMARQDAVTLCRTFVSSANNQARDMVYRQNADVVRGWKWMTAGDNRVCPICLALHGREFKLGEGPDTPIHPRCRCIRLPKTITWRELGIPMDEMKQELDRWVIRGRRDYDGEILVRGVHEGGKDKTLRVGRYATADDWFSDLSTSEKQSTSLGPGRVKLLEDGRVSMKDLVGPDYQPRTLKQLEALADAR
ncbi:minor capsid protein [Solidesulfovibrio alcoholivorans]|uniref:minor capsid protein n=1 Tax=Solidesulfovibrio alcoholivorans TaxID=81406 RepID=UPI0004984B05|nr:minor capsid protein [Solidesulfovibrio alcoholivorans]